MDVVFVINCDNPECKSQFTHSFEEDQLCGFVVEKTEIAYLKASENGWIRVWGEKQAWFRNKKYQISLCPECAEPLNVV